MTVATDTLLNALATCDMLEVDGLHAFDFTLDDNRLLIECMDGRAEKRWSFTQAQLKAATFDETRQLWTVSDDSSEYRLACLSAFSAREQEDEEHDDA
ncbi:hypothetical protein CCU68_28050 [Pseudomonas gingeri NCPPB 3146 = LMG 5327]|uniref:DUF5629 family protein n=2 Tax=Pseudomonas gingeri TaxID=117681 RepID=A0A7Y7XVZ3_9PSED|nr:MULTISPECIES: DUF5629 family protein [Pseudomonas]NVZ28443.1 DUF5629 family protein [Pseudomonas gingeri]NVZ62064.1 DUF5629 family protein [Pseudomonas gingeri]NVZ77522.1 DUF5629 family protein [Pseudomonas gingeri]NWC12398.1 DUF5629 family protein [Pseudomonas gingeri]NWE50071.1 DUF5629 family protein [Pseudomonas gingeri]